MNDDTPISVVHPNRRYTSRSERIIIQCIHWGVVLFVVIAVAILALYGKIDKASITALYGGVLGHAGTSASHRLAERYRDDDNG